MDEIEKGVKEFLDYWFAGFSRGLGEVDDASRRKILHACGAACAESYTAGVFREVKRNSPDLDSFLANLSARGSGSNYERLDEDIIRATYHACGCDLVRLGLVKSPALCECSAANLAENLRQALEVPVSAAVETSILRGAKNCVLIARLHPES